MDFLEFEIELHDDCEWDFLIIEPQFSLPLPALCGYLDPFNVSISGYNEIFVHFHSDHVESRKGFHILYNIENVQSEGKRLNCGMSLF